MENTEYEYLPYCANRYRCSLYGQVQECKDGNWTDVPKLINEVGNEYVTLAWYNGVSEYEVGLIILISFEMVNIPLSQCDAVELLFANGNRLDYTTTNNLIYRFRCGPLPVLKYPNYYYIPFATHYGINRDGEVISLLTGRRKIWSATKDVGTRRGGYRYQKVIADSGSNAVLYRHRALCLVFKRYDANVNEMVINHENGIKGDDRLDNINWSTYAENNQHGISAGLRVAGLRKVKIYDYRTQTEHHFNSITEAGKAFPQTYAARLQYWLTNPPKRIPDCMLLIKDEDDQTPWPVWEEGEDARLGFCKGISIAAVCMKTGERRVYQSVTQAEAETGVSNVTIMRHCTKRVISKRVPWTFRFFEDKYSLPDPLQS